MRFTVTWHAAARADLAQIWISCGDRQAVTAAADEIDRVLARQPESEGEDFYGDYLLVIAPLAVVYTCSIPDRRVTVLQVSHQ